MSDDQQQPGQPPAGGPGSWPPPSQQPADPEQTPSQPEPPQPPGWGAPAQPPAWGQPPQQPGWGQTAQQPPGWGQPAQQPPAWGQPPQQPGWGQPPQQQPGWGQPAQQPGWGAPAQQPPAWGQPPQQPPYGAQQFAPPPPGFAPPYGAPGAFVPNVMAYGPRYAGFWIRLVAYIIDSFIWGFLLVASFFTIFILIGIVLFPLVLFGYFPILWWKRGATFGQSVLGLRVVRAIDGGPIDGGMAVIRAVVFLLESIGGYILIGYLGFIWAAFEPRKRAWHDMAAGTVVIHTN